MNKMNEPKFFKMRVNLWCKRKEITSILKRYNKLAI